MESATNGELSAKSKLGFISLIISVIAWCLVLSYYYANKDMRPPSSREMEFIVPTLFVFGISLILSGLALGLGIGSFIGQVKRNVLGSVGAVLSSMMILAFLFILASTVIVSKEHKVEETHTVISSSKESQ